MPECNHILAFEEGASEYEAWLITVRNGRTIPEHDGYFAIVFNYCPMCGKHLRENDEQYQVSIHV